MLKDGSADDRIKDCPPDRMTSHEDAALVAETLQRPPAFAGIVTKYQEPLGHYLRRLGVRSNEDIEDLLQTIFLKTYRYLRDFDQRLKFSSWIYRIAHNEAVSFFRAKHIRPEGRLVEDSDAVLDVVKSHLDIEHDVNATIDADRLKQALVKLPTKYQDVLVLRFFEERDYSEISDILRIPMGTVATLLNRAKKQLRSILQHE